jgi:hemolysin activation/secretion protein
VWEYRVEGNTLLSRDAIERAVYRFLGPSRGIDDVEGARAALEARYREEGYATVLVNIPEQDVVAGVVRLEVIEGKVDRLRVTGSRYFLLGRIRAEVPALAAGQVPHLPTVQEQLARANRASPDRAIIPVLRQGRFPGTVEAELKVSDDLPLHGSLDLNNNYTSDTTKLRINAAVRYDNLWQRYHSLGLQYQVSPEDPEEVSALAGTYVLPVADGQDRLALYAVSSDSNVASLGGTTVVGTGTIFGLRYVHPISGPGEVIQSLTLGADYKDLEDQLVFGSDEILTPIDYTVFSASYSVTVLGEKRTTTARLGASFGPRGFGFGNEELEFENKRFRAEPNFFYLRGGIERAHTLPDDFESKLAIETQLTNNPLVSSEQLSAGGMDSVRGYPAAVALGDRGVRGSVELISPPLGSGIGLGPLGLRLGVFIDAAKLWVEDALPDQPGRYTLLGTGFGLDASLGPRWIVHLDWALALRDVERVKSGDSRWHFQVGYEF